MLNIEFQLHDGRRVPVQVAEGATVMDAALDNGVPGIIAQCGGGCTCCTCHCYLPQAWLSSFEAASEDELALLEYAWELRPASRLACQLRLGVHHDGLVVEVPERQSLNG